MGEKFQREFKRAIGVAPIICGGIRGRLVDISRGGLAFTVPPESKDHFEKDAIYDLMIKTPQTEAVNRTELHINAQIRSISYIENQKRCNIGAQFVEISDTQKEQISQVILFFATNFGELQNLHQLLDSIGESRTLNVKELQKVYQVSLDNYENLPVEVQKKIHEFAMFLINKMRISLSSAN
ncbi:MAG: PilZ domain-containing protein [SAR324 cluster bacterium]|nr:PilZ domain-containing protein [SAR324 cluster bacterium]